MDVDHWHRASTTSCSQPNGLYITHDNQQSLVPYYAAVRACLCDDRNGFGRVTEMNYLCLSYAWKPCIIRVISTKKKCIELAAPTRWCYHSTHFSIFGSYLATCVLWVEQYCWADGHDFRWVLGWTWLQKLCVPLMNVCHHQTSLSFFITIFKCTCLRSFRFFARLTQPTVGSTLRETVPRFSIPRFSWTERMGFDALCHYVTILHHVEPFMLALWTASQSITCPFRLLLPCT